MFTCIVSHRLVIPYLHKARLKHLAYHQVSIKEAGRERIKDRIPKITRTCRHMVYIVACRVPLDVTACRAVRLAVAGRVARALVLRQVTHVLRLSRVIHERSRRLRHRGSTDGPGI